LISDGVTYRWRGPLTDAEMVELVNAHGGNSEVGWWDRIRPHSLGWVTARVSAGRLVGLVNVVFDGGDHAFLIDTKTHGGHQRKGIGTRIVHFAAQHAKAAGCETTLDFPVPDIPVRRTRFTIGRVRPRPRHNPAGAKASSIGSLTKFGRRRR